MSDVYSKSMGRYRYAVAGSLSGQSGSYYHYKFPALSNSDEYYRNVYYVLHASDMPDAGTYGLKFEFLQGDITFPQSLSSNVTLYASGNNVTESSNSIKADLTKTSIGVTCLANVSVGYSPNRVTCIMQWPEQISVFDVLVPQKPVQFTYSSYDAPSVSTPDINAGVSAGDALITVTGQVNATVTSIDGSIKKLIQTIVNQLDALWDQFAGVFTNMFTAWNTHVSTITQAIQNQGSVVSDGLQDVTHEVSQGTDEVKENQDKNTNIITNALSALGNFIIEGLKGLFIPSDEFFSTWFNDLYECFSDRMGFFMLPEDLVVDFAGLIADADSSFAGVPFPEISWDGTVIVSSQMVGFDVLETDWGQELQQLLYFAGDLIMIGALLNLMHRKFEEVLNS